MGDERAVQVGYINAEDFASRLERALNRATVRSQRINQPFPGWRFLPFGTLRGLTFFSSGVPSQRSQTISAMKLSSPHAPQTILSVVSMPLHDQ